MRRVYKELENAIKTAFSNTICDIKTSHIVAVYEAASLPLHSACGGTS